MDGPVLSFARSKSYDRNAGPLYLFQYTHSGLRRLKRARELSFALSEPQHAPAGEPSFLEEGTVQHFYRRGHASPPKELTMSETRHVTNGEHSVLYLCVYNEAITNHPYVLYPQATRAQRPREFAMNIRGT